MGVELGTSIVPGSQGDSNTEPAGPQATVMDATWPQVRYWGGSFTLRGYKSVSCSQSWLAILNPSRPFIKIQTPRHYPRSTESECQGIRFHNVCICKKQKQNKANKQTNKNLQVHFDCQLGLRNTGLVESQKFLPLTWLISNTALHV